MTKYTVKANVSNITQLKDGTFDYNQEIVWMKWDERKGHTQSGDGPGEFGPDYSDRKKYHQGELKRHMSEWIHAYDDGRIDNPPHGVGYDPYDLKPIKRSRTTPLTKEEIEHRHEQLKKDHEGYEYESDRNTGRTHKD